MCNKKKLITSDLFNEIPELTRGHLLLAKQEGLTLGIPTGLSSLDQSLFSKGLPRGALSLLISHPGQGMTSLWLQAASSLNATSAQSLWISHQSQLFAPALVQQQSFATERKSLLEKIFVVQRPTSQRDFRFVLRECLEAHVFQLVGCQVESLYDLRRDLPKIRQLCERSQTAFVFLSSTPQDRQFSIQMDLVIQIKKNQLLLHKTKNRPPQIIPWRSRHAYLLPESTPTSPQLDSRGLPQVYTSNSLSRSLTFVGRHQQEPTSLQKL